MSVKKEHIEKRNVFGRFYSMPLFGKKYNCRDVLDILDKSLNIKNEEVLKKKVDAIFIMMNPGSSEPLEKGDNGREMVKTKPDKTQNQVMALMEKLGWSHVRILNLSDLRNAKSQSFYKLLREVAEIPSGERHSIFSISRKNDLEKLWKLKDNAPVIVAWGVADKLNPLIIQCMDYLNSINIKPTGWLKPGTKDRFYHPYSQVSKNNQLAWVRIVSESIGGNTMKILNDIYKEIWEEKNGFVWKYYKKMGYDRYPINIDAAKDFIHSYFITGNKAKAFNNEFGGFINNDDDGKNRAVHSVSLYFLGIGLEKFFLGQTKVKPDFRYIWFLTSFYHDMGYYFENKYKDKTKDHDYEKKFQEAKNEIKNLKYFKPFSADLVLKYNEMLKEKRRVDHGFFAGSELYKQLTQNYYTIKEYVEDHKKNIEIKNKGTENEEFTYRELKWSKKQFEYFGKVAGLITVHNIWFSPPNKKEDYEIKGLQPFIIYNDLNGIDKKKRISVNSNPLFALLTIADTIEPLKKFDYNLDALKNFKIALNYQDREIRLNFSGCKSISEDVCDSLFRNIKELQNWLKVSVNEELSGDVVIKIEG